MPFFGQVIPREVDRLVIGEESFRPLVQVFGDEPSFLDERRDRLYNAFGVRDVQEVFAGFHKGLVRVEDVAFVRELV